MGQRDKQDVANSAFETGRPCDLIFTAIESFHDHLVDLRGWELLRRLVLDVLLIDLVHLLLLLVFAHATSEHITQRVLIRQHVL